MALFETRFSPGRNGSRAERQAELVESLRKAIGEVESLDADRVLSSLLAAVTATQRTTYYAGGPAGAQARPRRGARPARAAAGARGVGQLAARHGHPPAVRRRRPRWAALVRPPRGPAHRGARPGQGADGEEHRHRADRRQGRLRRQAPATGRRLPRRRPRRGAGLLQAVHRRPAVAHRQPGRTARSCRRRRSSGTTATTTYLVVAADKGTATFSDLANSVALERGFWLGDAFASGGSVGYDHKAMGITARGAWESVTRHFRELDLDVAEAGLHRRRHRRHVRRRLRQRDAAVGAHPAGGRVRPPARVRRPHPRRGGVLRRAQAALRAAALVLGRLQPLADQRRRRRLAADGEVDPGLRPDARRRSACPTAWRACRRSS